MTKHEFLAMNLPYGLCVISECDLDNRDYDEICIYKPYHYTDEFIEKFITSDAQLAILRPLSDLTKEIEHKGERFVPMVELAEMCRVMLKTTSEWRVYSNTNDIVAWADDNYFKYNQIGISFSHIIRGRRTQHIQTVFNQMELILKLIEWHFDIAGLIEKGEAIDVNTLPENPYK